MYSRPFWSVLGSLCWFAIMLTSKFYRMLYKQRLQRRTKNVQGILDSLGKLHTRISLPSWHRAEGKFRISGNGRVVWKLTTCPKGLIQCRRWYNLPLLRGIDSTTQSVKLLFFIEVKTFREKDASFFPLESSRENTLSSSILCNGLGPSGPSHSEVELGESTVLLTDLCLLFFP